MVCGDERDRERARSHENVGHDLRGQLGECTLPALLPGADESFRRVVVRNGQMVIRNIMSCSLSVDHRVVDGALGATFLQTLRSYIEQPATMLLLPALNAMIDITTTRSMAAQTHPPAIIFVMLCVMALETQGLTPKSGDVLVTGAAGGVGSVAVAILAKLGYRVVASTGRADTHQYLKDLGAAEIIDRATIAQPSGKPLESERWAGCIDSVGGATLAAVLPQMKYRSSVAACGLAGGNKLETTVIPFIIRGVKLLGVDSVMSPPDERWEAWSRLARDLPPDKLDTMIVPAKLEDLPALSKQILDGKVRGRVVVEIGA